MSTQRQLSVLVAIEGAVDRFCGRPRDRNPYSIANCPLDVEAWDLGHIEAGLLLELRGQEEAARWLRENRTA